MQPPPSPPSPQRSEIDRETLFPTPSFRRNSEEGPPGADDSRRTASLAEIPAVDSLHDGQDTAARAVEGKNDDDDDDEFEFAVFAPGGFEPITADEIFSNGHILPMYPLFNRNLVLDGAEGRRTDAAGKAANPARLPLRKLMMGDRDPPSTSSSSAASSESDEMEGIPVDSYCVWTPRSVPPPPDQLRQRSHSTGFSPSRRWRLRDLVMGRSHSDGRKKFVFLAAPHTAGKAAEKAGEKQSTEESPAAAEEKKKVKGKVPEMDIVTAHRIYYGKGAGETADRRRSFLPYRKDLVGFHPF